MRSNLNNRASQMLEDQFFRSLMHLLISLFPSLCWVDSRTSTLWTGRFPTERISGRFVSSNMFHRSFLYTVSDIYIRHLVTSSDTLLNSLTLWLSQYIAHGIKFDRMSIPAGTWRLYNVVSTSMQRHDVASTLRRRCIDVICMTLHRRWGDVA